MSQATVLEAQTSQVNPRPEQTRARYPDQTGYVTRDGVNVFWEAYGEGPKTLLFLPTWSIVHSRCWKAQIGYLSRHFRVVTYDPRGNGRSDRPTDEAAYAEREFSEDAVSVMDAAGVERSVIVCLSRGTQRGMLLATEHPDRVEAAAFIGPWFPVSPIASLHWRVMTDARMRPFFERPPLITKGWGKFNAHHIRRSYPDFVEWYMKKIFSEPHSTKQIEDAIGWANEIAPDTLIRTAFGECPPLDRKSQLALAKRIACPVLVVHGTKDGIAPHSDGEALAKVTGGTFRSIPGAGHLPQARKPVEVNLALRSFAEGETARKPASPVTIRKNKRALFVSSPIGLGHAQRDIAIACELRKLVPGLEIDWLAQNPVTRVLAEESERVHPASALLANESKHIESESAEHDLHAFQALRRMDEIMIANFMVFHDVVRDDPYDLWIGDEAWEIDYYLHENPNEKRAKYAWLTDFVGWLPMPDGGEREADLTTDYNAEMIEHIDRHPAVRDRAIFVGNPDDIVPGRLGKSLPGIRDWTERHFDFAGYVTGFDPRTMGDREALRAAVGYRPDEQVCIVTVGGSGVGAHLLRRVIASFPHAKRQLPALRMIVVAGPRIDPLSLPHHKGLEVVAYVHNLYRHLAACDLAVVQGGLTTAMELTASKRPFLYFPLRHHFEQSFHVRHRLERYGAGRAMDFESATPESIASAITEEIGRKVRYADVETDGAHRAALKLAELL